MFDPEKLELARDKVAEYWDAFERKPEEGRAYAAGGPKIVIAAESLAITLPAVLDDLLGEAGMNLSIYGFGKAYGMVAVKHFAEWCRKDDVADDVINLGGLYWPMHMGLTRRVTVLSARTTAPVEVLVGIEQSVLSSFRIDQGLDPKPARMFVAGMASALVGNIVGAPLEGREAAPKGDKSYRILLAEAANLAVDLNDPKYDAPEESYCDAVQITAC